MSLLPVDFPPQKFFSLIGQTIFLEWPRPHHLRRRGGDRHYQHPGGQEQEQEGQEGQEGQADLLQVYTERKFN